MNDSNVYNKKKIEFNLFDLVIILLLVLCIIGVALRNPISSLINRNDDIDDYRIIYEVSMADITFPDQLKINDTVYCDDGQIAGTVSDVNGSDEGIVDIKNSKMVIIKENGEKKESLYPDNTYIDFTGEIICSGYFNEDGLFLLNGKTSLAKGQVLVLHTDTATMTAEIVNIVK